MTSNIEASSPAQLAAWQTGGIPEVERVQDGLWSIPVPIPANPLRYVLVYALELDDGVAIVDAGWDAEEAWSGLTVGLKTAGFDVSDVRAVLVTHVHPDHYGLAGRVREASGAWIGLHPADAGLLEARYENVDPLVDDTMNFLRLSGVPHDEARRLAGASLEIRKFVDQARPDRLFEDGQLLDLPGWNLQVVWTPGHSPGHVCFLDSDRRILLAGDHVLPGITPNISIHPQQPGNPLAQFLEALSRVGAMDVDEVLSAHEYRFHGLAARVEALIQHHHDRMDEIEALVRQHPGQSCWDLTQMLTWSVPWSEIRGFQRRAATGETLAHLVVLEVAGRVARVQGDPVRWIVAADR